MKKINFILVLITISMLVGCTLGNTPTSRVEARLTDYQMINDNIDITYTYLTSDVNLPQDLKDAYETAIERQYKNMSYEIKEEVIDGDTATVTVAIEVMNYGKAISKYDKTKYEETRYNELILEELETTKEMVTYTIDFTLTKEEDETWIVDEPTNEVKAKLLGIY